MSKKFLSLILSIVMVMSICTVTMAAEQATTSIQILYTNDIHGYYATQESETIGFASLKKLADDEGADIILDIGDTFHGQAFATVEEGQGIAELMNDVGYDAMTPGNHDWSYGADRLLALDEMGSFSILAANVVTENGETFFDVPYLVKEVIADDGTVLKVGIVGVVDDQFYLSTASQNVDGLIFGEEAKKATEIAKILRDDEACDIVIAITHQHDPEGFVKNSSGFDVVLAGHEHIVIDKSYLDSTGKQVPVFEAGYYFQNAGLLELTFDTANNTVQSITDTVYTPDMVTETNTAVSNHVSEIEQRQQAVLETPVGFVDKDYPYSWEEIRVSEQEIGKLVTEAYIDQTGCDVAIENAGGIRAGLESGEITYKDVISISPYGNVLITKELSGKDLLSIFSKSFEINKACSEVNELQKVALEKGEDPYQYSWPDNSGSALQFSGIEFELDENNKIVRAAIGGKAVDATKTYTVALNNYLAGDSDDYPELAAAETAVEYCTCEEALRFYFEKMESEAKNTSPATRGEVVQMLLNAADDYNLDVQKTDIIKGYEDGQLHEEWLVTRAEALVMLKRTFGTFPELKGDAANPMDSFTDIPTWAAAELAPVFHAGIVAGTAPGTFSPNDPVTIEQMNLFIERVYALYGSSS